MRPTIYVSGPIKGHDDFAEKFQAAAAEVSQWADPVNPVEIRACANIPTDSKLPDWGTVECRYPGELLPTGHTWQCYMRHDIEKMVHCDGIYMMRGWELSKGACEELRIAQMLGMKVSFQPEAQALPVRTCRQCGCTDDLACTNGGQACWWVAADLCSACSLESIGAL